MTTNDNTINGNGSNLGIKLGLLGDLSISESYSIMTGVNLAFNQGGTLLHDEGGDFWGNTDPTGNIADSVFHNLPNGVNLKYGVQYVEIPIGLHLRTKQSGYTRFFAEIPVFHFGFSTKARGDIEGAVALEDENINKEVNPLAISWGFGGGMEYFIGDGATLVGGVFYQSNFVDVTRNKNAVKNSGEKEDSRGAINGITIRLGVMF